MFQGTQARVLFSVAGMVLGLAVLGIAGLAAYPLEIGSAVPATERYFHVNASSLRLREKPDLKSRAIGLVLRNRLVIRSSAQAKAASIAGRRGEWIPVTTLEGRSGHVFNAYLRPAEPQQSLWYEPYRQRPDFDLCRPPDFECLRALSARLVRTLPELSALEGQAGFRVRTLRGKAMDFRDVTAEDPRRVLFYPVGRLGPDSRYFVFYAYYYEGGSVVLVDRRTEKFISLWGQPSRSPDGRHLFVLNASDVHDPNGFQIVRLSQKAPEILHKEETDWYGARAEWTSNRSLRLQRWFEDEDLDADASPETRRHVLLSEMEIRFSDAAFEVIH